MPSPAAVPSPSSMLDNLDFRTAHLGHFPLIRALITKLGIDRVLNEVLPQDPRSRVSDADCVAVMILNILSGRCALYAMPQYLAQIDTDVVLGSGCPADAFNDARLAGTLDHLFDAGTDYVLGRVVSGYLTEDVAPVAYSVHADTTSLSLEGAFDVIPAEGAPTPARGFSKDHRPDLKQRVFGLSVHGSVGVPLAASMLDGNTSDKAANRWNIEALAEALPQEHDVTVVGDSKRVDPSLFGRLLDEGFHFVSLVPKTYGVRAELVELVRQEGGELPELARSPGRTKADPDNVYRGRSFRRSLPVEDPHDKTPREVEMTLVVVRSDAQARKFDNALDKRLVKEKGAFMSAVKRANKRHLRCREDAEEARHALLDRLKWQTCELTIEEVKVTDKRPRAGRPRAGEVPPSHTEYQLVYDHLTRNEAAIERAAFHAAHYLLVTDRDDWDAARILQEYRHQSLIEGTCGFRWLKNVALVAPIFLKTPHRIAALGLVFVLALMVRNDLQFELRRQLKAKDATVRGRKERVRTQRPTAETALLNFMGLSSGLWYDRDRLVKRRVDALKPDAITILELLGIPPSVFTTPYDKWPPLAGEIPGM